VGFKKGLCLISAIIQILAFYSSYPEVFYLMNVFFGKIFVDIMKLNGEDVRDHPVI
jgi:hypothetical protein